MKLQDLAKSVKIFESLSQGKVNVKLAYKLMKVLKETKNDIDFYQEKSKEIIEKYAQRDDKNEIVITPDQTGVMLQEDKIDEFNKEYIELNETEITLPEIKFEIDEFEDVKLSAVDLMAIDEFLK